MKFRKFLKNLVKLHKEGQETFNSASISRRFSITNDHAYRDLWRLWRMGFLNRRETKRKHHYYINKKGWAYLKYLHTYEPNFHISSMKTCDRIREMLLQQKEIFSDASDSLGTFSLCLPDKFHLYGLYKYFRNKRANEKFNELNENILEELDLIHKISFLHANKQLKKASLKE